TPAPALASSVYGRWTIEPWSPGSAAPKAPERAAEPPAPIPAPVPVAIPAPPQPQPSAAELRRQIDELQASITANRPGQAAPAGLDPIAAACWRNGVVDATRIRQALASTPEGSALLRRHDGHDPLAAIAARSGVAPERLRQLAGMTDDGKALLARMEPVSGD